jgi:hypothetical protein
MGGKAPKQSSSTGYGNFSSSSGAGTSGSGSGSNSTSQTNNAGQPKWYIFSGPNTNNQSYSNPSEAVSKSKSHKSKK